MNLLLSQNCGKNIKDGALHKLQKESEYVRKEREEEREREEGER